MQSKHDKKGSVKREPYKRPQKPAHRIMVYDNKEKVYKLRRMKRKAIYDFIARANQGRVPCFVCGNHVKPLNATLEHIKPLSKGGTDKWDNLAISHWKCNNERGNETHETEEEVPHWVMNVLGAQP